MKHYEVVCAVIENDDNKIFVCKRGNGKELEGKWEFPGGKVEANETHENTIIREVKEELDSYIKPIKYIGKIDHTYNELNNPFSITLYVYICKLISGKLTLLEHLDAKWIKKEELKHIDFADADKKVVNLLLNN